MRIRTASAAEIGTMVVWAAREGWNPGHADAECFRAADPEGFLVGEIDGQIAACISVVGYSKAYGFLGFYICDPNFRGRGHGWTIWQAGIARLGTRTIGLDGVVAQQDNYRRSGFVLAHRNVRYVGRAPDPGPVSGVTDIDAGRFSDLVAFDARHFGTARPAFLRAWLAASGHVARVVVEQGRLRGYAVRRPCRDGHKVAPLFAETPAIAERLLCDLAHPVAGAALILDLPEPNVEAVALARRFGMTPSFETARMYRGESPQLPLASLYGLTSFELG